MMHNGYSYSTYVNWDLWVPIATSILTILLTVLSVTVSTAWFKLHRTTAHHSLELAFRFSRLVLGDSIRREVEVSPPRLTLFDREVSPLATIFLATLSPSLLLPGFVSFWASFLVEETFACDPGLDCFFLSPSSFGVEHTRLPLTNCTDLDQNATVVCFQFVFDYAAGFASMGGVFVVAVVSLRVYAVLLAWLVGVMPSFRSGVRCRSCRVLCSVVGVFVFFLAPVIISVVILLAVLLVPFVNDVVFQSSERTLKFATFWFSLLFSGTLTGVCLLGTLLGTHIHRHNSFTTDVEREAEFTSSFVMTATNPLQQNPTSSGANLNSLYKSERTQAQQVPSKQDEPDPLPPKLVGSMLNSYRDVTSLPPHHTESSVLLSAPAKSADYKTT